MRILSDFDIDPQVTHALINERIPSRIRDRDARIYDFSGQAVDDATVLMGWTTLASDPPFDPQRILDFVTDIRTRGITDVVLVGQGGSTQAAMVLTKFCANPLYPTFTTIDYLFPSTIKGLLDRVNLNTTLFIIASKSGSTVEPLWTYGAIRAYAQRNGEDPQFIAITDPGSPLEDIAREDGFLAVFPGADHVGGRFSALSTFGLLPAACVGTDIVELLARAKEAELACSQDTEDNPAVILAGFLYTCLMQGRDKFSLISPAPGRVFGLWVEQLIAESLGKIGRGILPNIEIDPSLINEDTSGHPAPTDRCVIALHIDHADSTSTAVESLAKQLPLIETTLDDPLNLGAEFVVWEYATALLAYLMKVNAFNQPNVSETKRAVDFVLSGALLAPPVLSLENGMSVDYSPAIDIGPKPEAAFDAFTKLFGSLKEGDYFGLLSFVPFTGTRRASLEQIRSCVAKKFGVASCLEIGPRYLHSTGQFYKGGPNTGIFLIISADDPTDLPVGSSDTLTQHEPTGIGVEKTLGTLLSAQARGDLAALSNHGRRALHVHLPDWDEGTLEALAEVVCLAAESITTS